MQIAAEMFQSDCLRKTALLTAAALIGFGVPSCAHRTENRNQPTPVLSGQPKSSFPMPPLNGPTALGQLGWVLSDGRHITIGTYHNKVLVLDLYATWCEPCRESIPHLIDLEKKYEAQGLSVVGLNVGGPDDLSKVPAFARAYNIQYPLGTPDQALTDLLMSDNDAIPQTFVFDRQGRLIKRYVGYYDSMTNELEEIVSSTLESAAQ
jgi:thiol-disulfide isomerase/thioredoxin